MNDRLEAVSNGYEKTEEGGENTMKQGKRNRERLRDMIVQVVMNNLIWWIESDESEMFRDMYKNYYMKLDSGRNRQAEMKIHC